MILNGNASGCRGVPASLDVFSQQSSLKEDSWMEILFHRLFKLFNKSIRRVYGFLSRFMQRVLDAAKKTVYWRIILLLFENIKYLDKNRPLSDLRHQY
jgi:hypothetical protein